MSDMETDHIMNNSLKLTAKSDMKKKQFNIWVGIILLAYTIMTLTPFYFLIVRSFVPTAESSKLHLFPPKMEDFNMNNTYGNVATYYNVDLSKVKKDLGLKGYINPNQTWAQISGANNIDEQKIINYFNPYVKYNGWITIIKDDRIIHSLVMTILLTVSSIIMGGLLSISTASVLAGFRKKWHRWVYSIYMLQMIITPIMIIIPVYLILGKTLGLANSYLSIFLIFIKGGAIPVMIFTSYIAYLPVEMKESIEMDGGNRVQYFFYILLPLVKVPFATFTAISFPLFWNDLLQGQVFLSAEKYTLVPMINALQGSFTTNYQAIYAGLCLSIIPIIIIYLCFQNLFVRSALSGAVKG